MPRWLHHQGASHDEYLWEGHDEVSVMLTARLSRTALIGRKPEDKTADF
jgi:hypothetical protein